MSIHECKCSNTISEERDGRWVTVCLECGDWIASQRVFTAAPGHKSNYHLVTNLQELKQLNPKRSET